MQSCCGKLLPLLLLLRSVGERHQWSFTQCVSCVW